MSVGSMDVIISIEVQMNRNRWGELHDPGRSGELEGKTLAFRKCQKRERIGRNGKIRTTQNDQVPWVAYSLEIFTYLRYDTIGT